MATSLEDITNMVVKVGEAIINDDAKAPKELFTLIAIIITDLHRLADATENIATSLGFLERKS